MQEKKYLEMLEELVTFTLQLHGKEDTEMNRSEVREGLDNIMISYNR